MKSNNHELHSLRRRYINARDILIGLGWERGTVRMYMDAILKDRPIDRAVEFFEAIVDSESHDHEAWNAQHEPLLDDQLEHTLMGDVDLYDLVHDGGEERAAA